MEHGGGGVTGRGALRGTLVTSVWTLASRILGFVRDALMAAAFGLSPVYGAFTVAWIIPNLFRRLFGEGVVGAAVQPALARARAKDGAAAAGRAYARFHGWLALALVLAVAVGEGILGWRLTLPGRDPDALLAMQLAAILLPYAIPICLTALAAAPQQLDGRFLRPALAPVLLNTVWITCLLLLRGRSDPGAARLLAGGVLLGGLGQWLLQFPGIHAAGFPLRPRLRGGDVEVSRALRAFLPALAGLAALQINMALDQGLVWLLVGSAANACAYLANRLLQLPLALIGIAAATGTLPLFARLAAEGRPGELGAALRRTAESTLLLILAAAAGLWVLAPRVVTVLFEHGQFHGEDSLLLTATLRAYLGCLPGAALAGLMTRARQACGDYRGPALVAFASIPVNLSLDLLLLPRLGVPGAGYATAGALSVQAILLFPGMHSLGLEAPLRWRRLPRVVLPGAAAALAAWAASAGMEAAAWNEVLILALAILAGVAAAVLLAWVLVPEDCRALLNLAPLGGPDSRPQA